MNTAADVLSLCLASTNWMKVVEIGSFFEKVQKLYDAGKISREEVTLLTQELKEGYLNQPSQEAPTFVETSADRPAWHSKEYKEKESAPKKILTNPKNPYLKNSVPPCLRERMQHRLAQVTEIDGSTWQYGYDPRGQLNTAQYRDGTGNLWWDYGYTFDAIGNRLSSSESGQTTTYTPNSLNQYTSIVPADAQSVIGKSPQSVTINGNPTTQANHTFKGEVTRTGTATEYPLVNITDGTTAEDLRLFFAQNPTTPTYDNAGNLLRDDRFDYTWDAEQRLIEIKTRSDLLALNIGLQDYRVTYSYDYRGRLVSEKEYDAETVRRQKSFLYRGNENLAELIENGESSIFVQSFYNFYTWGLDISGTMGGAGGVGGLLGVDIRRNIFSVGDPELPHSFYPSYDGNGNIIAYHHYTGSKVAHLAYSPFGEILEKEITNDETNNVFAIPYTLTRGFSTKRYNENTRLVAYEYRFYDPELGRWLNRDPIAEDGGLNLYGMVGNDPVNNVDVLGLSPCCINGKKISCPALSRRIEQLRTLINDTRNDLAGLREYYDDANFNNYVSLGINLGFAGYSILSLGRGLFVNAAKAAPTFIPTGTRSIPVVINNPSGGLAVVGSETFKQVVSQSNRARNIGAALVGAKAAGSELANFGAENTSNTLERVLDPFGSLSKENLNQADYLFNQYSNALDRLFADYRKNLDTYNKCCK